jgi:CheY-like chemotaxis protein
MLILDGIQATEKIRQLDQMKTITIIGLSAGLRENEREICLQSGMNDYLGKPFEIEDLAKILLKYLSQRKKNCAIRLRPLIFLFF